jgi:hypothetical protein
MSFVDELLKVYNEKRTENKEVTVDRRNADMTLFFEKEVKAGSREKMMLRANAGRPTANITEYISNERFYVDDNNAIVRYVDTEVSFPNYRIHDVVTRDNGFKNLLLDFEKELGIKFSCWKPTSSNCVIEAIWGRNRYHTTTEGRGGGGRGGGRGRGRGGRVASD